MQTEGGRRVYSLSREQISNKFRLLAPSRPPPSPFPGEGREGFPRSHSSPGAHNQHMNILRGRKRDVTSADDGGPAGPILAELT